MKLRITNYFGALALFLFSSLGFTHGFADENNSLPTIQVSATGSAQLAPDMAVLSLSVVREAKTAREALDTNNRAMARVIKALSDAGLEQRDLQTSGFNIQPRYKPRKSSADNNRGPQIIGYSVTNSLTVRIRQLSQLGEIMDMVVTLGVNSGGNVRFTNDDPSAAITKARIRAMKNATTKAQTLADGAGVKLGEILLISENTNNHRPVPVAMARASIKAQAVPVASGENSYWVTVNVSWKIDQ